MKWAPMGQAQSREDDSEGPGPFSEMDSDGARSVREGGLREARFFPLSGLGGQGPPHQVDSAKQAPPHEMDSEGRAPRRKVESAGHGPLCEA